MVDRLFDAAKKGRAYDLCLEVAGLLRGFLKDDVCFGTLKDSAGYTLLDHAVQHRGSVAVTRLLLHPRMRFDLHRPGKHGLTPLAIATARGNRNTALALYRAGANPLRCVDYEGRVCTVVDMARRLQFHELARSLTRWGWRMLADAELWRLTGRKRPIADSDDDGRVSRLTDALDSRGGGERAMMARALLLAYERGLGEGDSPLVHALFHGKRWRVAELLGQYADDAEEDCYRDESCPALQGLRESSFLHPLPPRPSVVDPYADLHPFSAPIVKFRLYEPPPARPDPQPSKPDPEDEGITIRYLQPNGGSGGRSGGGSGGGGKKKKGRQPPPPPPQPEPEPEFELRPLWEEYGGRVDLDELDVLEMEVVGGADEFGDWGPDVEPVEPSAPALPPPPPSEYTCPLSLDWLDDPVTAPSGHSYSRVWIERHLNRTQTDPITRQPLFPSQLYPNRALRDAVARARALAGA